MTLLNRNVTNMASWWSPIIAKPKNSSKVVMVLQIYTDNKRAKRERKRGTQRRKEAHERRRGFGGYLMTTRPWEAGLISVHPHGSSTGWTSHSLQLSVLFVEVIRRVSTFLISLAWRAVVAVAAGEVEHWGAEEHCFDPQVPDPAALLSAVHFPS